jgi:hypothetical protein
MTKIPYKILIIIGILIEITLLIFFDEKTAAYGPIIFWIIGGIIILNSGFNSFKLSNSVKRTKPEVFKRYSFGPWLTNFALLDKKFLATLNEREKQLLAENQHLIRYFFVCFILFAISGLLIFFK